jgi:hypothetical protein
MLREFENNLIAETPVITDRKGRRWSLQRNPVPRNLAPLVPDSDNSLGFEGASLPGRDTSSSSLQERRRSREIPPFRSVNPSVSFIRNYVRNVTLLNLKTNSQSYYLISINLYLI